ncbi:MAG: bifunctional oligoribonuclease and phosphatase NrnA [Clostridiales bacterium]|jgi:phosphoesterase RecJ-like protein|nr:bifunctional oligoribonuclease and phosphatase NrnA [Clostridiales bacterium]
MTLNEIAEIIKARSNIAILPHIHPDGDCIGSSFALLLALQMLKKEVTVVLEENIPQVYSFLTGKYVKLSDLPSNTKFDMVICLDSGDEHRLNHRIDLFNSSDVTLNIDHHISNTMYAKYNYVDSASSATGEIVYDIINLLGVTIDKDIAVNLYVAISTDTGGFKYSNTTSKTHRIIAELLETNINIAEINRRIFDTVSLEKLKLTATAIDWIEFYENNKIAAIALPYDIIQKEGLSDEDSDGLANLPRNIEGVEVGLLFKEKEPGEIKVSFRSNQYVDVSKIAISFGGGGHKRASGCTLHMDMIEAKKQVIESVKQTIKQEVEK